MKVVSTEALTKLIQLVKSAFIKVEDVVETSEVTLADVSISGDYDDLINKPTIPTVNNASLTIQKNGTNVATFTANASSDVTANISVPNTVSSVSSSSTNSDAVGAKLFYDTVGDIEAALHAINSGSNSVNLSWYGVDTNSNRITINNETVVSSESVPSSETLIGSYSKGSEVVLYFAWERQIYTTYKLFINDTYITSTTGSSSTIEYTFTLTEDTVIRLVAESSTPTPPMPS